MLRRLFSKGRTDRLRTEKNIQPQQPSQPLQTTKAPSQQQLPSQIRLEKVPVRVELFYKLKEHDKLLENYVEEYVCCAKLLSRCKEIRELLALGTTDPTNLEASIYWQSIRNGLNQFSEELGSVLLRGSDFAAAVTALKEPLQIAINAVDDIIRALGGAEKIAVVTTVSRSIDQVWGIVVSFIGKTQTLTKGQLLEIGKIIERIDELIIDMLQKAEIERQSSLSSARSRYGDNLQRDNIGKIAELRR